MCTQRNPLQCIVPPYMMKKLVESDNSAAREAALQTLIADAGIRGTRETRAMTRGVTGSSSGQRSIYDARNSFDLSSAELIRSEGDPAVNDDSVNRAFDGFGTTRDFLEEVFDRNSLDDQGFRLEGYVHVGSNYNNASFDGEIMRFGDGDGSRFTDFTLSLDIIAHELMHGLTTFTSNFRYWKQPGALNESMSDVFGSLVKQWANEETADQADWLIGAEVFTPGIGMDALRSLSDPGNAYDHPLFGRDPQPSHMDNYFSGSEDNYGVHINSGIPNKAFYVVATILGDEAWTTAGHIWYEALLSSNRNTQFQEFADRTYLLASAYGSEAQTAVAEAWRDVGIRITGIRTGVASRRSSSRRVDRAINDATLDAFAKRIEDLAEQVLALSKEVKTLKPKRTTKRKSKKKA